MIDRLDDRYRIDAKLRDEGAGAVYQATDERMGRPVAVRLIDRDRLGDEALGAYAELIGRLATVAHPNLVPIYDLRLDGDQPYVVEAMIEGETAARQLRAGWRLQPGDVAEIAEQLASALAAVHRLGLVHGHLGPSSVLVDTNRTAYLVGFGSGDEPDAAYRAPAAVAGETPGAAGDVYGLAAVLYALLCGAPPGPTAALTLDQTAGAAPKPLRKAILSGLSSDPLTRPDAAGLLALLQQEPPPVISMPETPDLARTQVMDPVATRVAPRYQPPEPEPRYQPAPAPAPSGGGGAFVAVLILALIAGAIYVAVAKPFGGTRLPALAGQTEAEAKKVLGEYGLQAVVVERVFSDTVPGGGIVSTKPAANQRVRAGDTVELTLSKGPRFVNVPSVVGLIPDRAKQVLMKSGLSIGATETAHRADAEEGVIVAQSPPEGRQVEKGSLVTVHVNDKPDTLIESVQGRVDEQLDAVGERLGEAVSGAVDEQGARVEEAAREALREQGERLRERTREMGRNARDRVVDGVTGAVDNLRGNKPEPPAEEPPAPAPSEGDAPN